MSFVVFCDREMITVPDASFVKYAVAELHDRYALEVDMVADIEVHLFDVPVAAAATLIP